MSTSKIIFGFIFHRLMVAWTVNLCMEFRSHSLEELLSNKCHGPVGGEFSYQKLKEKQNVTGSYILRQCEQKYDTYYIDIIRQR